MDAYDPIEAERNRSSVTFLTLLIISQVLGVFCVILTGIWLGAYWGGFSWTDVRIFNYHPLFMVLGLVFLYGDAILVYRVFRTYRKLPIKVLHAVLHILAFLFAILGVKAVFEMHKMANFPDLYSLHSWIGIVVVVLFAIQWLAGLVAFLVPQMPQRNRACYLPVHVSFGSLLYLLIIGTCVSGITQKNIFSKAYSSFLPREMIGNALGVCIVLYGAIVFYLISHPAYKRVEIVSPERRALNE
ncbi:hypothetical protein AHF37_05104 [Paragonimus kellicotti]|nr:hypothetical protein AHF37_05104 [Paragonimus kellicotti]